MLWEFASAVLFTGLLFGLLVCVAGFCSDVLKLLEALWARPWAGTLFVALVSLVGYALYELATVIAYPIGDRWSLPPNRYDALFTWIWSALILALLAMGVWQRRRLREWAQRLARTLGVA